MSTAKPSPRYSSPVHRRVLIGCLIAAIAATVFEALHLSASLGDTIQPRTWYLATLYAAAPLLALLSALGLLLDLTLGLKRWGDEHEAPSVAKRRAVWASLPVGIGVFTLTLAFILNLYPEGKDNSTKGLIAYFWMVPSAAIAGYAWHIASALLTRIDLSARKPISLVFAGTLAAAPALLGFLVLPGSVKELILSWPTAGLMIFPLIAVAGVALTYVLPWSPGLDRLAHRVSLGGLLLGTVGVIDLSDEMGQQPIIKKALLDHTLMSGALLGFIQPLFDRDGDGVAGKLGGADCDDQNPAIHPGAQDIPLNGIDEDCHEGDALPARVKDGTRPTLSLRKKRAVGAKRPERPNVILISIDTLRADHLHYLGYPRKTSPFLDELSLRGLTFEWAFSTGAQTRISMPAVFTGRYCSELSRSKDDWAEIYADNVTLAERLNAAGYYTVGIPAHNYFNPSYGLHQGFTEWNFNVVRSLREKYEGEQGRTSYHTTGGMVTDEATKWLDRRALSGEKQPFFMWLHYFDPHELYRDHPEYNFGSQDVDIYDEEIRYTDAQIERLFQVIEALSINKNTYVIIHSDHGEAFGDHGKTHHGQSLYNEEVRVPLLIIGPGLPQRRVKTPVSLIDVTPTILDLVGVAPSPPEPRGVSLLSYVSQVNAPHPPIIIEMLKDRTHSSRRALIAWPWKLHYSLKYQRYKLYDLSKDPTEEVDRSSTKGLAVDRLMRRLKRFLSEETTPIAPSNR